MEQNPQNLPPSINSELIMGQDENNIILSESESEVKEFILRKLGYPVVRIELTDSQIKDSIQEALDEISPWIVQPEYITVYAHSKIDLSEFNIAYVISVSNADKNYNYYSEDGKVTDIFSYPNGILYDGLELNLVRRSNKNDLEDISWKFIRNRTDNKEYLYLDVGTHKSKRVTIEYSAKINNLEDLDDDIYKTLVKKFALAFARETIVSIRGKYKVEGSPIELDASMQNVKSTSELTRLRQELKDTVSTHFMID